MTEVHVPVRAIISPRRGSDGLFVQPHDASPEREVIENHNRMRFANHFDFADMYTGNTRTVDPLGRYNCGRCNQADGSHCLLVAVPQLDLEAGSCRHWENQCAGDPEMPLHEEDAHAAAYGVAINGVGFGCHRCPYASAAFQPDSRGRALYCGKGDFRTFRSACCELNGAPTLDDGNDTDGTHEPVDSLLEGDEPY